MSINLKEIRAIRHRSYEAQSNLQGFEYQASRGAENGPLYPIITERNPVTGFNIDRTWASYDIALPTRRDGTTVSDELDRRIKTGLQIRLLDIGCGSGSFLVAKKLKYGDQIHCVGITAKDFASLYYYDREIKQTYAEVIGEAGVKVIQGDAQHLHKLLKANKETEPFDVITAQGALHYMGDPLSVVKQAYRILRCSDSVLPGVLFAGLDGHSSLTALLSVSDKLVKAGYDIEFVRSTKKDIPGTEFQQSSGGIIMTKNGHQRLKLPLEYNGVQVENELTVGLPNPCILYKAEPSDILAT